VKRINATHARAHTHRLQKGRLRDRSERGNARLAVGDGHIFERAEVDVRREVDRARLGEHVRVRVRLDAL
jgi:hypothetical protein